MVEFIKETLLWILALYGFIEIIKTIKYSFTYANIKSDKMYFILAVKNQEDKIEGTLRSILFRILYGKEEIIKNIIIADLDSNDDTLKIATKLEKEYDNVTAVKWKECKEIIEEALNTNNK